MCVCEGGCIHTLCIHRLHDMSIEHVSVVGVYVYIKWIELARICINEGICGLNWKILDTDWFVLGLV
jgi:hypothetical protein